VRDEKVKILQTISPIPLENVILGQYEANQNGDVGYRDDPTVPDGSNCPTFCACVLFVNTPRFFSNISQINSNFEEDIYFNF